MHLLMLRLVPGLREKYCKRNNERKRVNNMINEDYIKKMFPRGRLTILGGRPLMGKTSFVLSVVRVLNAGVLYLSLREDASKVVRAVNMQERRKKLLKRWSFNTCDIPGMSVEQLECLIRNHYQTIIINYVELMNLGNDKGSKCDDRSEELRQIYEQLDLLAKKYNCRIIGMSMLGRFSNPTVPRFEECLRFLDPNFLLERLIILHRPSKYNSKLQSAKTDYVELISKNSVGEEIVDRFSVDKNTRSIIRLMSSGKRSVGEE